MGATAEADRVVVLHGVSWNELERRLARKGDDQFPRIAYLDGELQLMSSSVEHERASSNIGSLVVTYALDSDIEISAVGSWLLTNRKRKAGCEPDEGSVPTSRSRS